MDVVKGHVPNLQLQFIEVMSEVKIEYWHIHIPRYSLINK